MNRCTPPRARKNVTSIVGRTSRLQLEHFFEYIRLVKESVYVYFEGECESVQYIQPWVCATAQFEILDVLLVQSGALSQLFLGQASGLAQGSNAAL